MQKADSVGKELSQEEKVLENLKTECNDANAKIQSLHAETESMRALVWIFIQTQHFLSISRLVIKEPHEILQRVTLFTISHVHHWSVFLPIETRSGELPERCKALAWYWATEPGLSHWEAGGWACWHTWRHRAATAWLRGTAQQQEEARNGDWNIPRGPWWRGKQIPPINVSPWDIILKTAFIL